MFFSIGVVFLCIIALITRINKKTLIIVTFVFLSAIAILFEPQTGLDLYTHYRMLDIMRRFGYVDTVARFGYLMGNLPVYSVFFYLVSLLQFNKLLLVITYLVVYGCMFHVLSMCVEDHGWSLKGWKIGYVLVMLITNAYSVTGIRYTLAFAVVFLFLYIDLVRKKHRLLSLIVCVLMCLLHDGMILILAFRLLLYIPATKITEKLKYLILFWQGWLELINNILRAIPYPFFSSVADKLMLYSTQESANTWIGGIGMQTLYGMRILILAFVALYCLLCGRDKKSDYQRMLVLLILFCFGGISSMALIDRYTTVTFMYALPFILDLNGESNRSRESDKVLIQFRMLPMLILSVAYFGCLVVFQYQYFI